MSSVGCASVHRARGRLGQRRDTPQYDASRWRYWARVLARVHLETALSMSLCICSTRDVQSQNPTEEADQVLPGMGRYVIRSAE